LEHAQLARQSHRLLENRLEETTHLLTSAAQRPARDDLAAREKLKRRISLECSAELRRLVKADETSVDEHCEHSTRVRAVAPERRERGLQAAGVYALNERPYFSGQMVFGHLVVGAPPQRIELATDVRPEPRRRVLRKTAAHSLRNLLFEHCRLRSRPEISINPLIR